MESESLLVTLLPLWVVLGIIAGVLIQLYIMKTDKEREKAEMHIKPERRYFIWKFLAGSLLPACLLIVIHLWLETNEMAPQSLLAYVPFIFGSTAILYFLFFYKILRRAKLKGNWRFWAPITIVLGLLFPPLVFLSQYPYYTQGVTVYETAHGLSPVKSAFIRFKTLKPLYDEKLDVVYSSHVRGVGEKYDLKYIALVPLEPGPSDSVYSVWIYLTVEERVKNIVEEAQLQKAREEFLPMGREYVSQYDFGKVEYYENDLDHRLDDAWKLLKRMRQYTNQSVILNPSTETLNEDRNSTSIGFAIFFVLLVLGTLGAFYSDP